jgi:hypothetical protein
MNDNYGCGPTQPTVFSFDFDNTITRDPVGFLELMKFLEKRGHLVIVCTARPPDLFPEDLDFIRDLGYKVYFSNLTAKRQYLRGLGVEVDVWVDDSPGAVVNSYPKGAIAPYTFRNMPEVPVAGS